LEVGVLAVLEMTALPLAVLLGRLKAGFMVLLSLPAAASLELKHPISRLRRRATSPAPPPCAQPGTAFAMAM